MKNLFYKWLAVAAVLAVLCAVLPLSALFSATAEVTDALTNGGFESGTDGWTVGGKSTLSDDAYSGSKALQVAHTSAWGEALIRYVAVEPNTEYTLSFRVKRALGSGVWHSFVLDASNFSALPAVSGQTYFSYGGGEWHTHSITINSGDRTRVMLKFCPESANSGSFLIDDVTLTTGGDTPVVPDPPVESDELLSNGGFEFGTDGWSVGGKSALSDEAHSGGQALLMSHPSAWGEALTRTVTLEKNTEYTLTFWVKRVSGGGAWNVYALNPSGYTVIPLTSGEMFFTDKSKEWVSYAISFNTGDLTSVFLKWCPESTTAGTFLIDDVSLTLKGEEPVAPPAEGLTNGGFEQGLDGWTAKSHTAISEDDSHSGVKSLLLSCDQAWGEALTRTVAVEANTDYVLSFWYKRASGGGAWDVYALDASDFSLIALTEGVAWMTDTSKEWVCHTVGFHSGDRTSVFLKWCPESANSGNLLLDDVTLVVKGEEPPVPDEPPVAPPLSLDSFSVTNNRPLAPEDNLIVGGDFTSAEGAQWNVNTFLSDTVTVVEDSTREDGYSLYFNTSGTVKDEWHIFWIDVEPETDYIFSAWVKGSFLSADSLGRATVGVIDPDTQKFLVHKDTKFSNNQRQIVPPAWDNEWHLRSVSFNSASKTKVGVAVKGHGTQLWVDDISLHKNDAGVKYVSSAVLGSVKPNFGNVTATCKDEDNLVTDGHLDAADGFWQSGTGWKNGFLTIEESAYEYGASLKYTASGNPKGVNYVKWMEVKPNTEYTFSVDMKILEDGDGKLVLLDGKKRGAMRILQVDFSEFDYGSEWFRVTYAFNTSVFSTIGIGVVDGGGVALLDNIRFFESTNGAVVEDAFVEPPVTPDTPSPDTGVTTAAVAMAALVPASALTAYVCRKKRKIR